MQSVEIVLERLTQSIHAAITSNTIFGNKRKILNNNIKHLKTCLIHFYFLHILEDLVNQLEALPENDVLKTLIKCIQV